jgi:signal transduction histidine kinase
MIAKSDQTMQSYFQQIFTLLTTPPGNLTYHLVLAFSIFGALQASLNFWRGSGYPQGRRMVYGLSLLLITQLALFLSAALAWQEVLISSRYLPVIDRAVMLFSLVIIIWLWVLPEPQRIGDAVMFILLIGVLAYAAFSLVWWSSQDPQSYFNGSWADTITGIIAMALLGGGMLALAIRRPNGWGIGMGMLAILFTGSLVHWLSPLPESNFAGAVRLAEMAAFPLLLTLPQRFPIPTQPSPQRDKLQTEVQRSYSTDPKVTQAFLALATQSSPEKFYQDVTRTVSQLMLADICLLALPPDINGQVVFPFGYDLIQQRHTEGFSLSSRQVPVLVSAIKRGKNLRLPASSTSLDLKALAQALGQDRAGHLLAASIAPPGEAVVMDIVLLSPYSNRGWTSEKQAFLSDTAITLALILTRIQDLGRAQSELASFKDSAGQTSRENEQLLAKLNEVTQYAEQEHARAESLAALITTQESIQKTDSALETQNKLLRTAIVAQSLASSDRSVEQLEGELRLALEEISRLKAGPAITDLGAQSGQDKHYPMQVEADFLEEITGMAFELRQPMSSISGYTELLLGESVGLLGALQRKFLERIKVSIERMSGLVDDLIQAMVMENGEADLNPGLVDLNEVIDEAVADTISALSAKNIVLRVIIPEDLPILNADRDALQQALVNLLQNAGSATPEDGEISLQCRVETKENEPGFVLLQVSDSGGGIPREDYARVFSRLYRDDNTPIPGVGDSGVALSTVKALVEAHGGRIWVDSEIGRGSVFSLLLPLEGEIQGEGISGGRSG